MEERIKKLEEENRNLKKENKRLMSDLITTIEERDNNIKRVEELEEENRKLRGGKERLEELQKIKDEIKDLRQENNYLKLIQKDNESQISCYFKERDELRERIRFLEQCLDNKEKVNKQLREEIKELNKMMLFETELEK